MSASLMAQQTPPQPVNNSNFKENSSNGGSSSTSATTGLNLTLSTNNKVNVQSGTESKLSMVQAATQAKCKSSHSIDAILGLRAAAAAAAAQVQAAQHAAQQAAQQCSYSINQSGKYII